MLAARYDDSQLAEGQCLGRKERHNCSVIGTRPKRRMANPLDTGAGALPEEEQEDRQVEETEAAGGSHEEVPPGTGATADAVLGETAQNTAQGEGTADHPPPPREAQAGLIWDRQQRRAAEELQIAADDRELADCLKNGMGLLTHELERVPSLSPYARRTRFWTMLSWKKQPRMPCKLW